MIRVLARITTVVALLGTARVDALTLESATFASGGALPLRSVYDKAGCRGVNRSPALRWAAVPHGTRSFALTAFDPDAPDRGGWWHWVRFDIPAGVDGLAEGASGPGTDGLTSWEESRYGGPCPPPGPAHRYVFTLYALDLASIPGGSRTMTGPALQTAIRGHVLAKATLVGRHRR